MDDVKEVERLRARVTELEAQLATAGPPPPARKPGRTSPWWAVSSAVLITLACVLAPLSVVSVWASTELSNTDAYVETVSPLADDPAVQTAIANEVTTVIFDSLDVQGFTTDALSTLADQPNVPPRIAAALPGLAIPIANGVQSFTRDQVNKFVASPQFAQLWDQVNRVAHEQVNVLLSGQQGGALSAQGNTITLNLGPVIDQVKTRLVDQGFSLASKIPTVDKSFVLVQSDSLSRAQGFYSTLNTLGVWLPVAVLVLLAAGVVLARDRRRALLKGALGLTGAMLVLGVALALARSWYVGTTPANILNEQAAGDVFDTLVRFMRTGLRMVAVVGLVVALGAFLTGPSTFAVKTRATFEGGMGSLRGEAESAGWKTGRFGTWVYAHRRALQATTAILGGLVLVFWARPTGWVVLGIALVVVLLLAVIEFLATPPVQVTAVPAGGPPPGEGPAPSAVEEPRVPTQKQRTPEEKPTAESPTPTTDKAPRPGDGASHFHG
jgi:hypothetical protein